jgi:hypothetical protein
MTISQNLLSLGKRARGLNGAAVFFQRPVDLIVIHWIGPFPRHTVDGVRNWWENGSDGLGVQTSTHFIIKDENVLQCLPLNEVAWHSGDERNRFSIGIEVVPMNAAGDFSTATIQTLKELVAHIRKTHPNTQLTRHFDGRQGKDCPRYYTSVTSLLDGGGRVANPAGGNNRWEVLKTFLDGNRDNLGE